MKNLLMATAVWLTAMIQISYATEPPIVDDSKTISNAKLAGVKLGISIDDALSVMMSQGYTVNPKSMKCVVHPDFQTNPCFNNTTGDVAIQLTGGDSAASSKVWLHHVNGVVYWIRETTLLPENTSIPSLVTKYKAAYKGLYTDEKIGSRGGYIDFDDETPPPYNRKLNSPHATVQIDAGPKSGGVMTSVSLIWKDSVGLDW